MDYHFGDTKDLRFVGFAHIYNSNGEVVGESIVVGGLVRKNYGYDNEILTYLSSKTGKEIKSIDTYYSFCKETHPLGFEYRTEFTDVMGNVYYLGVIDYSLSINQRIA